jgi:hypothetical protein
LLGLIGLFILTQVAAFFLQARRKRMALALAAPNPEI